jgi:hypothetical protein
MDPNTLAQLKEIIEQNKKASIAIDEFNNRDYNNDCDDLEAIAQKAIRLNDDLVLLIANELNINLKNLN